MPFITYKKNQGRSSGFFLRYSGLCDRKKIPEIQDLIYIFSEVAILYFIFVLLVLHRKWVFLLIKCLKCAIYSISRVRVRVRVTLTLTLFTISH